MTTIKRAYNRKEMKLGKMCKQFPTFWRLVMPSPEESGNLKITLPDSLD
jgi:hypothetical protein